MIFLFWFIASSPVGSILDIGPERDENRPVKIKDITANLSKNKAPKMYRHKTLLSSLATNSCHVVYFHLIFTNLS